MSDAIPLPADASLEQYETQAKDFQQACKTGAPGAICDWAGRWAIGDGERIERSWRQFQQTNERAARCTLADARSFLASAHGFSSWLKFARHVEGLADADSPVSLFEAAVDAIVSGDAATLETLLRENPQLVRARSTRAHGSTLLHYVSANGVEGFRQKTPHNIMEITTMLLQAGADVNAESAAYGGGSTALGLTATSCHPEAAGVQIQLMELLIGQGARIDGPDGGSGVNDCLHNGRGQAAAFLANLGARLDLEGAAGVGRLDAVKSFFKEDGSLQPPATQQQMEDGFAWACEFGRTGVVDFLLQRGMKLDARLKHDGQTGLHWAAYEGHVETVELLLARGAAVDIKDASYDGTPLQWALYAWGNRPARESYYTVVARLVQAGATLEPQWYSGDAERERAAERVHSDPRMQAALHGEIPS